jgi:hypothetical protein
MFQYMPCAIKEMLWVVFVRLVSNCRVLGLACATTELDRIELTVKRVYLKERREYSVLALYSDSDGIDLSKTRIDFANEVWGARERMLEGRIEEGWGRVGEGRGGEQWEYKRASCWAALRVVEMASDGRDYFEVVWAQAHAHTHAQRQLARRRTGLAAGPDANNVQITGGRPFNLKPATPQNQQGNCKLAEKQLTRRRRCSGAEADLVRC